MTIAVALLLTGSLLYCVLVLVAVLSYLSVGPAPLRIYEPISILKPLHGLDEGLEENLRACFEQDYIAFEILFAAREAGDQALTLVEKLRAEYPNVQTKVIVTGEPPYPNAKVYSLDKMLAEARNDLLVMSDSDVRVTPRMLRVIAAEFQDPNLGIATCPYRAVAGSSFWSTLEAIGMNTEFIGGLMVARMIEGVKFAVGPTIAARRSTLKAIGGFETLQTYLAEDFVMGHLAAEKGIGVILSSYVIEHRIGSQNFSANVRHRLRWARSTRRSRPAGYIGQLFTNPLPLALILVAFNAGWWPVLVVTFLLRMLAAWCTSSWVLECTLSARFWLLLPLQDVASFLFWTAGFFGNTIAWRGRKYYLRRDGRFELIS